MPKKILTEDDVKKIKVRLWDGEKLKEVLKAYKASHGVSMSTICNIASGNRWPAVPWPDKSTGRISPDRKKKILAARREAENAISKKVKSLLK